MGVLVGAVALTAAVAGPIIAVVGGGDSGSTTSTALGPSLTDRGSMVAPTGVRDALARLKAQMRPGERVISLSIRPDSLTATVAAGIGAPERFVTLRAKDTFTSTSGTSSERGVPFGALDTDAPSRLIAAALRGSGARGLGPSDYVLLSTATDPGVPVTWAVYLDSRERWTGDAHGRHVLRPEDGAPAPAAGQRGPAKAPTGITGASLVRAANLRRAIAAVRPLAPDGSLVIGADVRPVSVTITTRRGFRVRRFTVDAALGVAPAAEGETTEKGGVSFGSIDATGPERALRRIERRAKNRATRRVDYVLLDLRVPVLPGSRTVWGVYLKDGSPLRRFWRATLDGRHVGEPGKPGSP